MSQGNQIIQIAGQNGQPNQMIIVPQGNIILLPSNNDQNGIKTLQGMKYIFNPFEIHFLECNIIFSCSIKSISNGTTSTAAAATADCYIVNT